MIGFHGSDFLFNTFQISEFGNFGSGVYFTDSMDTAESYGEIIYKCEILLNKPLVIEADWESPFTVTFNFDSPSIEFILSLPDGKDLLESSIKGNGVYGLDVQKRLQRMGFDGIIAVYPDESKEIVCFNLDQISIKKIHQPEEVAK